MATTPNQPSRQRLVSLRRRFVWLLVGVVGLFMAGMALSLVFSLRTNEAAEAHLLNVELTQAKASVMRRWSYYRELTDNLARDPQLIELMRSGRVEELQQWASARMSLLPHLQGLALLSPHGEVYGNADALGIAPICLRDLHQRGVAGHVPTPVHLEPAERAHFDMLGIVREPNGAELGKVFLSVGLVQLQRVIHDSTHPGHVISLTDAEGKTIASSGIRQGGVNELDVLLPDMGWRLVVQSPLQRITYASWLHVLAGMLTLAGVLILLLVVVLRMRRPVLQDIDAALEAMACLTRNEPAPHIETRYAEFAHAAEDINRIAQQLNDQREQLAILSLTDALTGLPNRRAFETQFPHMLGLADRGHPIALVLLDVDHFKAINDTLGHAAGDKALVALARALKALTRSADMTARLAGDEFTVLLAGLDNQGVMAWYLRLADRFRSELNAAGLEVDSTLSAGQTWLQSLTGDSIGRALARADHALYQAKERGRNQLVCDAPLAEKDAG